MFFAGYPTLANPIVPLYAKPRSPDKTAIDLTPDFSRFKQKIQHEKSGADRNGTRQN
jgi:hypothetical protein